jgi:hypothetical protein
MKRVVRGGEWFDFLQILLDSGCVRLEGHGKFISSQAVLPGTSHAEAFPMGMVSEASSQILDRNRAARSFLSEASCRQPVGHSGEGE